jgi:hypothetical protein
MKEKGITLRNLVKVLIDHSFILQTGTGGADCGHSRIDPAKLELEAFLLFVVNLSSVKSGNVGFSAPSRVAIVIDYPIYSETSIKRFVSGLTSLSIIVHGIS